jgi:hypothetical protein
LSSWRTAGFDIIAVNGSTETTTLRGLDLPVEFATLATDGKPRISAIMTAIRARSCKFAGIINSDCRMLAFPNIAATLQSGLERRVVLAWRLDIDDEGPRAMQYGFDAFFLDTSCLPMDDGGFHIGEPWWDLWFPLACQMNGAMIETLEVPLLTHKVHPLNWNWPDQWYDFGRRFWTATLRPGYPYEAELHAVAVALPEEFRAKPQTISIVAAPEIETILRLCGRAMLASAEADQLRLELAERKSMMSAQSAETDQLRLQLAEIRKSTSWRVTAPLRIIVDTIYRKLYNVSNNR